ncbi:MAG TPA: heparan-alpha-glucosaminide N-acetyltransferase domain-containing protein [Bryobacteraceae bacterium]|nr:heparan-alpha-glucosaminide N-acetyltransferase domain-containing protein [Bryobacteraceae bacterium]
MKIADHNPNNRNTAGRLAFLDWMRGCAVLIMLQGHVFHSYSRDDLRNGSPYLFSQFLGGIGPAVFLFLTGITLAFLLDRRERQGWAPTDRLKAGLRRACYLLMLAFLFRIQMWLFGYPFSGWQDLLKVDVLNCMGLTIGLLSLTALATTRQRVRIAGVAGAVIAAASPLVSMADWSWLPAQVSAYFVPNFNYFAFFPWASYIAFGLSAGSILRLTRSEDIARLMQWTMLVGIVLLLAAQYFSNSGWSLYAKTDYWLNSPAMVASKMGVLLIMLAVVFLWCEHGVGDKWSPVRQLGTTSLIVYWTHIELVYGRWFWFFKGNLNTAQCVACALVLWGLMLGLSLLRTHWTEAVRLFRMRFPSMAQWTGSLEPQRASGD